MFFIAVDKSTRSLIVVPLISFSFWWILRSPLGFWPSVVHYEVSSCEFIFFTFLIIFCESWNVGSHLTISKNSAHHFFPLLLTFLILSFLLNILLNMSVPSAAHLHVCNYLLFFYLCDSFWVISSDPSSNSEILSLAMSNLLFIQPLNFSLHEVLCFSLKKFHLVLLGIHLLFFSTIYFFLMFPSLPYIPLFILNMLISDTLKSLGGLILIQLSFLLDFLSDV